MNIPETAHKTEQTRSKHSFTYLSYEDATIDLSELLNTLWKRKYFIIIFTFVGLLGAFGYVFFQPIAYKTETIMKINVQNLNERIFNLIEVHNVNEFDTAYRNYVKKWIAKFKSNLNSNIQQYEYELINSGGIKELLDYVQYTETNDEISFVINKFADNNTISFDENGLYITETPDNKMLVRHSKFADSASFSVTRSVAGKLSYDANIGQKSEVSNKPEIATKVLNNYVKFIESMTSKQLVDDVGESFANNITQVEKDIEEERVIINKQLKYQNNVREDEINRFEEAIMIASKLGIIEQNLELFSKSVRNLPLYMRGSRLLLLEIDVLRNRKYRDISEDNLTKLVGKLNYFRTMEKEALLMQFTKSLDSYSIKTTIISKNYTIILVIALIMLFIGIFLTLLIEFVHINTKPVEKAEKDN